MSAASDNHNEMAPKLVKDLVQSVWNSGGTERDICVLLQSVCTGVLLMTTKPGGEEPVMMQIASLAAERAREVRLRLSTEAGST